MLSGLLLAVAIEHMRIAAADRLIERDDEIAAYMGAQFNTLVLYDIEDGLPKSEERIAFETSFARAHGLSVLLGKPTEAQAPLLPRRRRAVLNISPDDAIRERLRLWAFYGSDVILGVFFLHDDAFLLQTTVERQRHLYALSHETVPAWPVLGIIGEFGFDASAADVDRYFDPAAFDHLLVLMYPLNAGDVTGVRLDSAQSADPDSDMRGYVRRYIARMQQKFVSRLRPGQLAILVIQAFAYDVEPVGHVPRPSDIMIEASLGSDLLRAIPGQEGNHAVAYFLWDGSRGGMFGLWQRGDWMNAAESANRLAEIRNGRIGINP
jgi:hypothetical protein